jgi:4-aminobutyrate aminotransferase-like enzyme
MDGSQTPRTNADWLALDREFVLQTRYTSPYVLERGRGCLLWDADGREFLDFHSGQVCANTGHCHPELVAAIARQLDTLVQTGSMFSNPPQILLARKLAEITPEPLQKSFFACSGSEAIEMALRAAKFFTGRSEIMGVLRSYHGMTMGAFTTSSVPGLNRQGYGYAVANVHHMPPPYCYRCDFNQTYPGCARECLRYGIKVADLIGEPAGIVVELVVSGGGVYVPPVEWVQELHAWCRERGILFIADECQTASAAPASGLRSNTLAWFPTSSSPARAWAAGSRSRASSSRAVWRAGLRTSTTRRRVRTAGIRCYVRRALPILS